MQATEPCWQGGQFDYLVINVIAIKPAGLPLWLDPVFQVGSMNKSSVRVEIPPPEETETTVPGSSIITATVPSPNGVKDVTVSSASTSSRNGSVVTIEVAPHVETGEEGIGGQIPEEVLTFVEPVFVGRLHIEVTNLPLGYKWDGPNQVRYIPQEQAAQVVEDVLRRVYNTKLDPTTKDSEEDVRYVLEAIMSGSALANLAIHGGGNKAEASFDTARISMWDKGNDWAAIAQQIRSQQERAAKAEAERIEKENQEFIAAGEKQLQKRMGTGSGSKGSGNGSSGGSWTPQVNNSGRYPVMDVPRDLSNQEVGALLQNNPGVTIRFND